jgi:hypothetical protein
MSWGEGRGERGLWFLWMRGIGFGGCFVFYSKSLLGIRPDLSLFLSAGGVAKVFGVVLLRGGCVVLMLKNRGFGRQERAIVEEEVPSCFRRS